MQFHAAEIITKPWFIKITDLFRHGLPIALKIIYIIFESILFFRFSLSVFFTLHIFFLFFTMRAFTLYSYKRFGLNKRIFHSHHLPGHGICLLFIRIAGCINCEFGLKKSFTPTVGSY